LSESWITNQQLILLLDGLDEVKEDHRNDCVRALNKFIGDYPQTEVAVCSRVKDYEALTERLQLSSALCLQPLSSEQVYQFLDSVGGSLAGLKTLLKNDAQLEQLAQTPLILSFMSVAYQGWSAKDLISQLRSTPERHKHLFYTYINRRLERGTSSEYSKDKDKDKVLRWLSWLASRMEQENQTIFLIEKMQPTWLKNRSEITGYKLIKSLVYFLLSLPILLSISGVNVWLIGIVALIIGLIFELFFTITPSISPLEKISWSWQRAKSRFVSEFFRGVCRGLIFGLIIGLIGGLVTGINALFFALFLGLLLGLSGGLMKGLGSGLVISEIVERTAPNQGIRASLRNSLFIVLIFGLIGGGTGGLTVGLQGLNAGLLYGGIACIQHFILRCMLYQKGRIPWDYEKFLDFVSERKLMKKVGGGYIFLHRMLLEYFARMNPN
jgi:F0F1-type ATP synthase membrane subunit c/vacuolar-type H+-ATPase subunit K